MPRIEPARPPHPPEIAAALQRIMPPGMEPLILFTALARNPRIFTRIFAGGLLDQGALDLRDREIVIDRTTARLGAEYEWGVHIALFGAKAGLDARQIHATVHESADADCWRAEERSLIAAVDDLVDHRTLTPATWAALAGHFDEAQILEIVALAGYYHTISFFCRALDLPLEPYAARFPTAP